MSVTARVGEPGTSHVLIGMMSGTSLDGISGAAVRFTATDDHAPPSVELLALRQREYSPEERTRLAAAMQGGTAREYCRLNVDLGEAFAAVALDVMQAAALTPRDVTAIASHGHTIWHEVGHSTWQIGESAVIAERSGCDVIADFRVADVAAGGQGAPLVPIADVLLFAPRERGARALQNLGGIGNVTVVHAAGMTDAPAPWAFDTGPANVIIDAVVQTVRPGMRCDVDGRLAAAGTIIAEVVDEALADPYFAAPPPKSTGRELFTPAYVARFIERCRRTRPAASDEDVIATATSFTVRSVADQYARFVRPRVVAPLADVVLAGGGARNPTLVAGLRSALAPIPVVTFDERFFDAEAKECVAFALMGWLHLAGRHGNVPSATGARGPRLLGKRSPAASR
ncbi:MAG: anhydro-N-acetylmuramic acid kinase [Gemmatimonadaceae bacterium]|nr:anhydro-N-acetylmuramic acid kinase [Gemmatimonadaceae bacterium]